MAEATARAANGLLNALTEDSWRAIEPYLEKHDLQHRDYISRADERIEHLYDDVYEPVMEYRLSNFQKNTIKNY
mgnify:CR=1 FL=1